MRPVILSVHAWHVPAYWMPADDAPHTHATVAGALRTGLPLTKNPALDI